MKVNRVIVWVALAVALLLLAFSFLPVFVSKAHAAGTGMPMMKGLKNPTELATLVERSLASDPTGKKLLDPARCKRDGSCATAYDYFHGIQIAHPSAKLGDIAELPRYLRSLVKQPAPEGEWNMSRLLVKGEKRTYDHMGWHRAFFKGEDAWDDPNTGEHILAGFCENVVGSQRSPVAEKVTPVKVRGAASAPVKEKCVELVFNAPIGGHVRWGMGTTSGPLPPDECNAQRQDNLAWTSWYGECDICIPAIGYIRGILGGSAQVPHKYLYPITHTRQTLRFSTEVWNKVVYICLEDGGIVAGQKIEINTCGVYMRPQDWQGRYRVEIPDSMWVVGKCPE